MQSTEKLRRRVVKEVTSGLVGFYKLSHRASFEWCKPIEEVVLVLFKMFSLIVKRVLWERLVNEINLAFKFSEKNVTFPVSQPGKCQNKHFFVFLGPKQRQQLKDKSAIV